MATLARRFGFESLLGAKIDSLADFILVVVVLFLFIPIMNPTIGIFYWLLLIALIKIIAIGVNFLKYGVLGMVHTYGNKIMGLYIFILPILIVFSPTKLFFFIGCGLGTVVAIEELLISITAKDLDLNKKSIFLK